MSNIEIPAGALLLSDQQAAATLSISRTSLWRLVRAGKLPKPIKVLGSTRFRREWVEALIAAAEAERDGGEAA